MKLIYTKEPDRAYPYLALFTGGTRPETIDTNEIVLISKINDPKGSQIHVQFINGKKQAFFTTRESDYYPLPVGCKIEFIQ